MSARVLLVLLVLHAGVGWLFLAGVGPGFPLDDSWLHLVYARSFAGGHLFAYDPGTLEAGVTAPLWTVLLSLPVGLSDLLGRRPDLGVRLLGGLMGLGLALAGTRLAARAGRWPAAFAGLALTFDPLLVADRFSGLEQPLFGLLCLLLIAALLDEREGRAGLLAGALCLTRPEGLALAALGGAWLVVRKRRPGRYLLPLVLVLLPWLAYLQFVWGRPWPTTVEGKVELVLAPGALLASVRALFADTGWGWALPLAAVVGIFSLEGGRRFLGRLPAVAALVLLAGVLLTRPLPVDGHPPRIPYYWERYALLAWPLIVLLAAAGLAALVRTAWAGLRCRPLYAAVLIGPLVLVVLAGHDLPGQAQRVRQRFADQCADIEQLHVAAGRWIEDHLPPDATVATHDAGAVRFFGHRRVIDVWGNQCHALLEALLDGGEEAASAWLQRQRPDALVCFPALFAADHSPELAALWETLPPQDWAALQASATDYAGPLGLTRRATTFRVDDPATVPSPLHRDLAIFVRP